MLSRFPFSLNRPLRVAYFFLFFALAGVVLAWLNPTLRHQLKNWSPVSNRKILATLRDNLDNSGNPISVFKVRENGTLFIEFYSNVKPTPGDSRSNSIELMQKLELPNPFDGYITFMGSPTNLAVADLDGDSQLELIVPSFNIENSAFLDVIRFNPALKKFELQPSFDIPMGESK